MKIDQYGVLSFVGHCTDTFYQMLLFTQLDLETLVTTALLENIIICIQE